MEALVEDRYDNIRAAITNNKQVIGLDQMDENRKRAYKGTLGRDNDTERDLDNDMIDKPIYVLFLIRYTKIKIYSRYIYICQLHISK